MAAATTVRFTAELLFFFYKVSVLFILFFLRSLTSRNSSTKSFAAVKTLKTPLNVLKVHNGNCSTVKRSFFPLNDWTLHHLHLAAMSDKMVVNYQDYKNKYRLKWLKICLSFRQTYLLTIYVSSWPDFSLVKLQQVLIESHS